VRQEIVNLGERGEFKMKCLSCGKENPEDVKFCIHCGQDLVSAKKATNLESKSYSCLNCGFENSPEARFCSQCGASLSGASPIRLLPRAYIGWIVGGIAVVAFFALFLAINKPWIPAVKWRKTSGDTAIVLAPVGPFGSLQGVPVETKGDAYPICPFCQERVNWRSTTCSHCGKSFRWVTTRCPACDGTGICSSCDGSGKAVSEMRGEKNNHRR